MNTFVQRSWNSAKGVFGGQERARKDSVFGHAQRVTLAEGRMGAPGKKARYVLQRVEQHLQAHMFVCNDRYLRIKQNPATGCWALFEAQAGFMPPTDSEFKPVGTWNAQDGMFVSTVAQGVYFELEDDKPMAVQAAGNDPARHGWRDRLRPQRSTRESRATRDQRRQPRQSERGEAPRDRRQNEQEFMGAQQFTPEVRDVTRSEMERVQAGGRDGPHSLDLSYTGGIMRSMGNEKTYKKDALKDVPKLVEDKRRAPLDGPTHKAVTSFTRSVLTACDDPAVQPHDVSGATKRLTQEWSEGKSDGTRTSNFLQVILAPSDDETMLDIVWCHVLVKDCFLGSLDKVKEQLVWECVREFMKLRKTSLMLKSAAHQAHPSFADRDVAMEEPRGQSQPRGQARGADRDPWVVGQDAAVGQPPRAGPQANASARRSAQRY